MLITFLRENVDVFDWEPSQMPGIPREVIEHNLRIYPDDRVGQPLGVVGQPGRRPKGQREASDVHRLHQPQQGMS